jgi:hypothetical protein
MICWLKLEEWGTAMLEIEPGVLKTEYADKFIWGVLVFLGDYYALFPYTRLNGNLAKARKTLASKDQVFIPQQEVSGLGKDIAEIIVFRRRLCRFGGV